jgi:hypothetical protein
MFNGPVHPTPASLQVEQRLKVNVPGHVNVSGDVHVTQWYQVDGHWRWTHTCNLTASFLAELYYQ